MKFKTIMELKIANEQVVVEIVIKKMRNDGLDLTMWNLVGVFSLLIVFKT